MNTCNTSFYHLSISSSYSHNLGWTSVFISLPVSYQRSFVWGLLVLIDSGEGVESVQSGSRLRRQSWECRSLLSQSLIIHLPYFHLIHSNFPSKLLVLNIGGWFRGVGLTTDQPLEGVNSLITTQSNPTISIADVRDCVQRMMSRGREVILLCIFVLFSSLLEDKNMYCYTHFCLILTSTFPRHSPCSQKYSIISQDLSPEHTGLKNVICISSIERPILQYQFQVKWWTNSFLKQQVCNICSSSGFTDLYHYFKTIQFEAITFFQNT